MSNAVHPTSLAPSLSKSSTASVDALLLGSEVKRILADQDLFRDDSTVEILEVGATCTQLLPPFDTSSLKTYLSNVEGGRLSDVKCRVIFIGGEYYPSNKLCCTSDVFNKLCNTFSITPRFIACLPRQQMPGAQVVYEPKSGQPIRHEMWYSLIERSHDEAFGSPRKTAPPTKYNVSKSVATWSRMNVWGGYNLLTHTATVVALRCPIALKEQFIDALGGDHGPLLLRHPTLSHAFLCNEWLSRTYDHLALLSRALYRLETSKHTLNDATSRSQQFLQTNREVSQVATDYKIFRESLTVLKDQHSKLRDLLQGTNIAPESEADGTKVGLFSFNDVLFDQFLAQLDLMKGYSDLYVKRAVIGMNEAFSLANQRDADLNMEVAKAMYSDGRALKSIQYLTMMFLPPSLAASIFGMGFFSTDTDMNGRVLLNVSGEWWMFLAVLGSIMSAMVITLVYLKRHKKVYNPLASYESKV